MKPLVIIKLGGSVITYKKSKTPKARLSVIRLLTKEIAQIVRTGKYRIVLVHGGGSFGHPNVKKFNLHKGMKTAKQKLAYAQTLQNMLDLNEFVIKSLTSRAVPAVSIVPHSFAEQEQGEFKSFSVAIINNALNQGLVPILFGDGVLDTKWGCSVLSGDTIVSYLARKLKAEKVVFLSDVDGIFEQDPKSNPRAKLIPEVNNRNFKKVLKILASQGASKINVTGEMYGKMVAVKRELRKKSIYIVDGLKQEVLTGVLAGKKIGTKIHFS
ncbi:MAG: Amino acid kinase [Microgenomates group bacterium Gr01-1014_5]|nr:MAG: Amino acid kinase [Microgenomates group bacterium Gr01-1014_5]